jgi:hypothetical protein
MFTIGKAAKWPLDHHILKALFTSRDVLCGNSTTEDTVDEFEGILRCYLEEAQFFR